MPFSVTLACWTCRLRETQCDSTAPFCRSCALVGIHCDGYSAEPAWLNSPDRKRRRLATIQDIIRRSNGQVPPPVRRTPDIFEFIQSSPNHDLGTPWQSSDLPPPSLDRYPDVGDLAEENTITATLPSLRMTPGSFSELLVHDFSIPLESLPLSPTLVSPTLVSPTLVSPGGKEAEFSSGEVVDHTQSWSLGNPEASMSLLVTECYCSISEKWSDLCIHQSSIMAHYMQKTFWDQYRMDSHKLQIARGWLLIVLTQSSLSLCSTLCVGAYHQLLQQQTTHMDRVERPAFTKSRYYRTMFQKLDICRSLIASQPTLTTLRVLLDVLFTISQILDLEVCQQPNH